jgi:hypothetical protein
METAIPAYYSCHARATHCKSPNVLFDASTAILSSDFFVPSFLTSFTLQIKWENRLNGDRGNYCLVSVDGVDFVIRFQGRKFNSHKFKFGSSLRYEFAVCILTEELVWINGPYKCGMWNDLMIIRNALLTMLGFGERLEADDGYRGESPRHAK